MNSTNTSTPSLDEACELFAEDVKTAAPDEYEKIKSGELDPTNPAFHPTTGRGVRNELAFWDENSNHHQEMWSLRFRHPDDMSGVFMEMLRAEIQGDQPELKPLRQKYYEHWALEHELDPLAQFCDDQLTDKQQSAWRGILAVDGWQDALDLTKDGSPKIPFTGFGPVKMLDISDEYEYRLQVNDGGSETVIYQSSEMPDSPEIV